MVTETKSPNLMASTWTPAAIVRRKFKAGPRRKTDLVQDVERAFLECRILYTEFRDAMQEAGIRTAANDVSVGLVLMTPWEAKNRYVHFLPVGGNMEALAEQARKANRLEKRDKALPIGVAFWQRDRATGQDGVWVRPWRLDANSVGALIEVQKALSTEKGNEFELEL